MSTPKCPGKQCCFDRFDNFTGCYDPDDCEGCVDGLVIKNDPDLLRLACLECSNGFNPPTKSICTSPNLDCCYGTCFKDKKDCKSCDPTTKSPIGCPSGQACCQNDSLTGIGCYDPNSSDNKCKKCENGQLVPKCTDPAYPCCPDTGVCRDPNCENCDGTPKCTGNNYCCNCGSDACCNKCETCSGGVKTPITLTSDDVKNCLECVNGNKQSKCGSGQECCDGKCISNNTGSCSYCDGTGMLQNRCTSPNFNPGVNTPGSSNFGKDQCCGDTCWNPITDKCGVCVNGVYNGDKCALNDPNTECCGGTCRDKSDFCTRCNHQTGTIESLVAPTVPGQVCCEKTPVPTDMCCGGKKLNNINNEECCNEQPYSTNDSTCCNNEIKNKNVFDCCDGSPFNKDTQKCCNNKVIDISSYSDCCTLTNPPVQYSPNCKVCTVDGVFDNYDSGCFTCNDYYGGTNPICKSSNGFACCSNWKGYGDTPGQCYDTKAECDTCITRPDGIKELGKKCKDPDEPDCCGGICWNASTAKCGICYEDHIVPKCPQIIGGSGFPPKRYQWGEDSCCDYTGQCYSSACDTCTPTGVDPNAVCENNTDGKTSCCPLSGGSGQCYNPNCYKCASSGNLNGPRSVQLKDSCKDCCNNDTTCCQQACCGDKCCSDSEKCCNNQCVPKDHIPCPIDCVPPDQCCNNNPLSSGQVCCGGTPYNQADCTECCNGTCVDSSHQCCHDLDPPYTIPIDTFCCKGECVRPCCNGTCCPQDAVDCCSGPSGAAGCYNSQDCKQCSNGTVTTTLAAGEECCGGIPFSPKDCETCPNGVIIPYTPSKPNCYCVNNSEVCECDKYPTGWVLSEGASAQYDGLQYGAGGLSPLSLNGNDYSYDGMSSTFVSSYCYTGYMSIYVTCSDGRRVQTSSFTSYCGVPNPLPLQTSNPCCP